MEFPPVISFTNGLCGLEPPFPRSRSPLIVSPSPLPDRGCSGATTKVYIITTRRSNMAAILSSGSLVAPHDYYQRHLGSTSSNSFCGSAGYSGEVIPYHPGLPKSDPGHWRASFFFRKLSHPFMTTVLESPEHSGTFQLADGQITCDLAQEVMRKWHVSEPSKTSTGPSA